MKMGRERAVMRWDVHASLIEDRIAKLEQQLAPLNAAAGPRERERAHRLNDELVDLHRQLRAIGPSPRAKMG